MNHSKQNPIGVSKSANGNPPDVDTVFNKILDSVCEVYFTVRTEKNGQKLLETIRQLRKLKESINLSH